MHLALAPILVIIVGLVLLILPRFIRYTIAIGLIAIGLLVLFKGYPIGFIIKLL
jgi:hypothetical protein